MVISVPFGMPGTNLRACHRRERPVANQLQDERRRNDLVMLRIGEWLCGSTGVRRANPQSRGFLPLRLARIAHADQAPGT